MKTILRLDKLCRLMEISHRHYYYLLSNNLVFIFGISIITYHIKITSNDISLKTLCVHRSVIKIVPLSLRIIVISNFIVVRKRREKIHPKSDATKVCLVIISAVITMCGSYWGVEGPGCAGL